MTLEAIEAIACNRNPTLTQAQAQIQGELGKAIQAGLVPNPTVSYVGEQWGIEGTAGEWQGAVFSQRIVTAGKLPVEPREVPSIDSVCTVASARARIPGP